MTELIHTQGLINGQWQSAASGAVFAVTNPATGETIAQVANMGRTEALAAVAAAHAAFPAWRAATSRERSQKLKAWFDLILKHADALAALMTAEQGKPLAEAKGEVLYGASFVEWFAEEAKRIYGDVIPSPVGGRKLFVMKEPIGVAAAITPSNGVRLTRSATAPAPTTRTARSDATAVCSDDRGDMPPAPVPARLLGA